MVGDITCAVAEDTRARARWGFWDRTGVRAGAALLFTFGIAALSVASVRFGGMDDDWTMAVLLSGRYDNGGLCLFLNAVLAQLIYTLNTTVSGLNWFFVIEGLSALGALFVLTYTAFTCMPAGLSALFLGAVAFFMVPGCTYYGNFTFVASLCSLAGGAALAGAALRPRAMHGYDVAGAVLCVLGFCWRSESWLLSLPFFCVPVLWAAVRAMRSSAQEGSTWGAYLARGLAGLRRVLVLGAAVGLVCAGLWLYDAQVWRSPGWAAWDRYNDARARISDYPMPPYDEVAADLAELGLSENDYYLVRHWVTADPVVFSAAVLEKVGGLGTTYELRDLADNVWHHIGKLLAEKRLSVLFYFAGASVLTLLCARRSNGALWTVAALVALGLACLVFFAAVGRLPDRVERPICLYALAAATLVVGAPSDAGSRRARVVSGIALVAGITWVLAFVVWRAGYVDARVVGVPFVARDQDPVGTLAPALRELDSRAVYLCDMEAYRCLELGYRLKGLPSAWAVDHTAALGGWEVMAPQANARNVEMGCAQGMGALLSNDDVCLAVTREKTAQRVLVFLREHYDPQATMELVQSVQSEPCACPVLVYRFEGSEARPVAIHGRRDA